MAKLDPEDNKKLAESSKNSNHSKIFLINQKNEKINTLLQLWIDRLEPSMNKKTSTSSSSPSGYNPETEDQNLGNFDFHKFFKAGK